MAIYRDIATNGMVGTIEDGCGRCWTAGPSCRRMQEAIGEFRTELGAAIDSVAVTVMLRSVDARAHSKC